MVSLLLPLPLSFREPLGVSSISRERAFCVGGAQVRLKASAGGSGTRPYEIQGTLRSFRRGRPAGGLWPRTSSVTLRVTPSPKGEGAPEGGG